MKIKIGRYTIHIKVVKPRTDKATYNKSHLSIQLGYGTYFGQSQEVHRDGVVRKYEWLHTEWAKGKAKINPQRQSNGTLLCWQHTDTRKIGESYEVGYARNAFLLGGMKKRSREEILAEDKRKFKLE